MSQEISKLGYWVCASFQHLKCFSLQAENIDEFEVTRLSGQIALLLNAIRGRGVINLSELVRIAKAHRIGKTSLTNNIIPLLQRLGNERVQIRMMNGKIRGVEEHLGTSSQLYEVVGAIWEMMEPSLIERGAIHVLKHTFIIPRFRAEELDMLSKDGFRDDQAEATLGITTSFNIIQAFKARKMDDSVLFNPYVWRANQEKIAHALSYMPSGEKEMVTQCLSQVSGTQALPVDRFGGDRAMLNTAQAIGLVDIVKVNTAAGDRKEFLFTPHLTTHPDVTLFADDLLNDVRSVLSCITYGETFSRISRLGGQQRDKTINFLNKLLRNRVAGDATAIGVDYKLLEERGIITVEPTPTPPGSRFQMRLLRSEPIKIALQVVKESLKSITGHPLLIHTKSLDPGSLFTEPEATRIQNVPALGQQPQNVREAREHYLKKIRKEVF
jgi:hypothetical protein